MNKKQIFVIGVFSFFLSTAALAASELKVAVSGLALTNIFQYVEEPFQKETGIKLTLISNKDGFSSIQVFQEIAAGNVQAGATAQDWESWKKALIEKKIPLQKPEAYTHRVIGKDVIQFFTAKDSGVKSLTDDQLTKILLGQIKNWREVGGPDKPMILVRSKGLTGAEVFLEGRLLGGKKITEASIIKDDNKQELEYVANTPGAIGFIGKKLLEGGAFNQIQHSSIGKPITFLTVGKPTDDAQKLLKFIAENAKKYGYD